MNVIISTTAEGYRLLGENLMNHLESLGWSGDDDAPPIKRIKMLRNYDGILILQLNLANSFAAFTKRVDMSAGDLIADSGYSVLSSFMWPLEK